MKTRLLLALLCLAAPLARAADTALIVDKAKSHVEIPVKVTSDSFTATLADYEAILYADPATERVTTARFSFRFTNVKTGNAKRDEAMNAWQQTDKFPTGAFELLALKPDGAGRFIATGKLELHGATRDVAMPVTIAHDSTGFTIDGSAEIDTRDFGLPVLKKFVFFKVDPHVRIQFHLLAAPVAATAGK